MSKSSTTTRAIARGFLGQSRLSSLELRVSVRCEFARLKFAPLTKAQFS